MKITSIRIRLMRDNPLTRVKATVAVTLDDAFAIHDLLIVEGDRGLFVAMPSRKCSDGVFRDVVHPIDSQVRIQLSAQIMGAYEQALRRESRS